MNWGIAVSVAVLLLGTGLSGQHPGGERGLFGAVLLAVGGLALAARRRAALAVLAVTGVCAVGYEAAGFEVLAVSYLVVVYGAVRAGHRAVTVAVSVSLLVVLPGQAGRARPKPPHPDPAQIPDSPDHRTQHTPWGVRIGQRPQPAQPDAALERAVTMPGAPRDLADDQPQVVINKGE
ncbi:hypothetical protein ACFW20_32065 [Streptomyces nigra]|uniref:hypothetical protein n=1 Tax=Streptomyces nigra TaxID=1827580 RepID=UPI0036C3FFD9